MEAFSQVETTVEVGIGQVEEVATLSAVTELSSIELAYVGGGTASVSFI